MIEALSLAVAALAILSLFLQTRRFQKYKISMQQSMQDAQKRNEILALETKEEQNRLLDALNDAFLLLDAKGVVLFINATAKKLFSNNNLIGRRIHESSIDPRLLEGTIRCLETGEAVQSYVLLTQQNSPLGDRENRGANAWMVDAAKLGNGNDSLNHTRIVIRDMTEEHHLEQVRKDFVANASHELRTPLAIIQGYIENLLEDEVLDNEELSKRFLSIMQKHTERISRIVEDMLMISRLESGENSLINFEPFELKSCIQDVIERLESLITGKQVEVNIHLHQENFMLVGDRFYWTQIIFNLVENALKQNATLPNLRIEIGATELDEKIMIWVTDDGMGIPIADLPYIFRRFYRVAKHHSQQEIKGTGLGLSIVKRAIEAHHGKISVTSIPGQETKFLMTLPKHSI